MLLCFIQPFNIFISHCVGGRHLERCWGYSRENLCLQGEGVVLRKHRQQRNTYDVAGHGQCFRMRQGHEGWWECRQGLCRWDLLFWGWWFRRGEGGRQRTARTALGGGSLHLLGTEVVNLSQAARRGQGVQVEPAVSWGDPAPAYVLSNTNRIPMHTRPYPPNKTVGYKHRMIWIENRERAAEIECGFPAVPSSHLGTVLLLFCSTRTPW